MKSPREINEGPLCDSCGEPLDDSVAFEDEYHVRWYFCCEKCKDNFVNYFYEGDDPNG